MGLDLHSIQKFLYIFVGLFVGLYLGLFLLIRKLQARSAARNPSMTRKRMYYFLIYLFLAYGFLLIVLHGTLF